MARDLDATDIGDEAHMPVHGRNDAAPRPEHAARGRQRLAEAPGHVGECREDEIAEGMSGELACPEPVCEHVCDLALPRQGEEAAARIAGRGNAHLAYEASRGAAVVGNRHDGCHVVGDLGEGAEGGGEPVSASEGNRARTGHARSRCVTFTLYPSSSTCRASSSERTTLRCRPPVQPTATDR